MSVELKTNHTFRIVTAEKGGYVVLGDNLFRREEGYLQPLLYAGSLVDCLEFIRAEIVKHD